MSCGSQRQSQRRWVGFSLASQRRWGGVGSAMCEFILDFSLSWVTTTSRVVVRCRCSAHEKVHYVCSHCNCNFTLQAFVSLLANCRRLLVSGKALAAIASPNLTPATRRHQILIAQLRLWRPE